MWQAGIGFPRMSVLVGLYTEDRFERSFSIIIVGMDKELVQERIEEKDRNESEFKNRISEFSNRRMLIQWEYT